MIVVNGSQFGFHSFSELQHSASTKSSYSLVLFTTEDGISANVLRKMQLFKDMSDLYHEHYHAKSILFTTTPELISFFKNSSVIVLTDFAYSITDIFNR